MAKKVGRLLAQRMLADRSELYRWLHDNRAEIEPVLRTKKAWQAVAKTAADLGVRTAKGTAPSRQAIRKTWLTLERDMAAGSVGRPEKTKSAAIHQDARPPIQVQPADEPDDDPPPRPAYVFRPGKPRE